jgi:hypothetical protein
LEKKIIELTPLLIIIWTVAVLGVALSMWWWRASGRELDRDAVTLIIKAFGGIALVGTIIGFFM